MKRTFWDSPMSLPLRLLSLTGWFLWQFVLTSLQVVTLIVTPGRQPAPGIVRMSINGLSETEITILVLMITITPDTLVVAVNRESGGMYVHGMFVASDAEGFRSSLNRTKDRLIRGMRRYPPLEESEVGA